jgi:hypothetical protein
MFLPILQYKMANYIERRQKQASSSKEKTSTEELLQRLPTKRFHS